MHPAIELRDHSSALRAAGCRAEADAVLEAAFSMAFILDQGGLPCACKIGSPESLSHPLASPAHGVVQICRRSVLVFFASGVEETTLMSLRAFGMFARLFSQIAARLPDEGIYQLIVNFSDGCETEGAYRRASYSCSRPDSILVPDYHFTNSKGYSRLRAVPLTPWNERRDIVFWRGGGIGRLSCPPDGESWRWNQRMDLCHHAQQSRFGDKLDIGVADHAGILDPAQKARIEAAGFIKPFVPKETFADYRYQIDIDGWSNSWVLLEKLIMGSTILKIGSAFGYRQWFYDRLKPWQHYVPVRADLADFEETLAWLFAHPAEAEAIARNGQVLAADIRYETEMPAAERRLEEALTPIR